MKPDVRHEYHKMEIVEQFIGERDRLRTETVGLRLRLDELHHVETDLAALRSPRKLIRRLNGITALTTGLGAAAVALFPKDNAIAFGAVTNAACFGTGIALLILAAITGFVLSRYSP